MKKDKESLVVKFEEEEERLINELSRKLVQLQKDKERLEKTLAKEQEDQVRALCSHELTIILYLVLNYHFLIISGRQIEAANRSS